jgi:hypothetical protein
MTLFDNALRTCRYLILSLLVATAAQAADQYRLNGRTPEEAFPGINGKLVQAAVDGDTAEMERLVKQGADPNAQNAWSGTPLLWAMDAAIRRRSYAGLQKILELGASANATVGDNEILFVMVARGKDFDVFRIFVEQGADVNKGSGCFTPLSAAAFYGDIRRIDLLLAKGADINGESCGLDAPMQAIARQRYDVALYLLSKGYNRDLDKIADATVNIIVYPETAEMARDKRRLQDALRQRGIRIPEPR